LLDSTVACIRAGLPPDVAAGRGQVIAGDTKHILAWVQENNPRRMSDQAASTKPASPPAILIAHSA
jgi:hypothetical protein